MTPADFFIATNSIGYVAEDLEFLREAFEATGQRGQADRMAELAQSLRESLKMLNAERCNRDAIRLVVSN